MRVEVDIAVSKREVVACQHLIARNYHRDYGAVFNDRVVAREGRIESLPDQYLQMRLDGKLIGVAGRYEEDTYIERIAGARWADIAGLIGNGPRCELARFVIDASFRGSGLGALLFACAFSSSFADPEGINCAVLFCSTPSVARQLVTPLGVGLRLLSTLAPLPVHSRYCAGSSLSVYLSQPTSSAPYPIRHCRFPRLSEVT